MQARCCCCFHGGGNDNHSPNECINSSEVIRLALSKTTESFLSVSIISGRLEILQQGTLRSLHKAERPVTLRSIF